MSRLSLIGMMVLLMAVTGVPGPFREVPGNGLPRVVDNTGRQFHPVTSEPDRGTVPGKTLSLAPILPAHEIPAGATLATARGAVLHWRRCPAGQIQGVQLDDGTEVRFPSYPADPLAEVAPPEQPVDVIGWRFPGDPVLHARWIRNPQSADEAEVDLPPL